MPAMPRDPDIAKRLMLALGGIIIRQADFEVDMLGAITAIRERKHEYGHPGENLPNHSFAAGITYLLKNRRIAGMEPFTTEIERITTKAKQIAGVRNFIAHGTLARFDEETETVHFRKYMVDDDREEHSPSHCEITLAELETVRDETAEMAREMFDLAGRLQQAFMPDTGSEILDL